jgi:CheY-like chemotaxis protein
VRNGARLIGKVNGVCAPMQGKVGVPMAPTRHIVVVDDNVAPLLGMLFEDEDYQFTAYTEIDGVVDKIRAAQPDIVILDLDFNGKLLGPDVYHALRANATTADLPIIITTAALNKAQEMERSLSERPTPDLKTRVMTKPFEHIEDILPVIDDMLET